MPTAKVNAQLCVFARNRLLMYNLIIRMNILEVELG
jgi:hypothetical protein